MNPEQEKAELLARRQALRARIESIEKDYRGGLEADAEEQAQQLENAEVLDAIARAAADELARIEERLKQLG